MKSIINLTGTGTRQIIKVPVPDIIMTYEYYMKT